MQIKSGKVKKVSQNYYNNYNNINNPRNNNIYYPRKVIINNTADLYKLPVEVIKKSKIYNFSGDYFNEIYEEALKLERNNGIKKLINPDEFDQNEDDLYEEVSEDNKTYNNNIMPEMKIEQASKYEINGKYQ